MLLATTMIGEITRPTVLVVDDESGPREAFRLVLESEFNVLTADSGWAARHRATRPSNLSTLAPPSG